MKKIYVVRCKDVISGVYDDLDIFFGNISENKKPDFSEDEKMIQYGKFTIEWVNLNENNIKPNRIIYKGKEFSLNNLEDPLPLVDVSAPSYL